MESVTKQCQNCSIDFVIESEDFFFYEKIKVPPPTFCPDCRQMRRYAWRNERTLYRRDCDLCKKKIVSIYREDSPYTVYCPSCWWSDGWDSESYGQDYDPSKSFFEQMNELRMKVPRVGLMSKNCVNSDYVNHSSNSKNCYMSFVAWESEDLLYSSSILNGKNCVDCYRTEEGSNERLYECMTCYRCYKCQYCYQVHDSSDCYYSFDLKGCTDCFLSYNLRGKSYCFMNEQLTREEYFERLKQYDLGSSKVREELYKLWVEIIQKKALHRSSVIEQAVDCTGNLIYNSKNVKNGFEANNCEDMKYTIVSTDSKDIMDCYHYGGGSSSLMYESHAISGGNSVIVCHLSYDNSFISYCDTCHNSQNLFGCISVRKGSYMILNKKYSEAEFKELVPKIIERMKEAGEYGEFFPAAHSPFGYNETQGNVHMPLSKEQAITYGLKWQDSLPGTFHKGTMTADELPDTISEVSDSILAEILTSVKTGRNYNIVPQELQFYRQNNIPIPQLHPDERYERRLALKPSRKLFKRTTEDEVEVLTAYAPGRPERIVSEEYYKKNVL